MTGTESTSYTSRRSTFGSGTNSGRIVQSPAEFCPWEFCPWPTNPAFPAPGDQSAFGSRRAPVTHTWRLRHARPYAPVARSQHRRSIAGRAEPKTRALARSRVRNRYSHHGAFQDAELLEQRQRLTAARSQLRALEAKEVGVSGGVIGHRGHVPALLAHLVGEFCGLVLVKRGAVVLQLRKRSGLLGVRGRDNEPSRCAPNSAASNENQGDTKRASVHRACVTRPLVDVKGPH